MYFWKGTEVLVVKEQLYVGIAEAYRGLLCVDAFCASPPQRYGRFSAEKESLAQWGHIPIENFPPQFRATLLIMGVS